MFKSAESRWDVLCWVTSMDWTTISTFIYNLWVNWLPWLLPSLLWHYWKSHKIVSTVCFEFYTKDRVTDSYLKAQRESPLVQLHHITIDHHMGNWFHSGWLSFPGNLWIKTLFSPYIYLFSILQPWHNEWKLSYNILVHSKYVGSNVYGFSLLFVAVIRLSRSTGNTKCLGRKNDQKIQQAARKVLL